MKPAEISDVSSTTTTTTSSSSSSSSASSIIVDWTGEQDPARPQNWPTWRKWAIVVTTTSITFVVSFGSSIFSAALHDLEDELDIPQHVAVLGISLYVAGFALGPMIWGPASELYGRTSPLWLGYAAFLLFQVPLADSEHIHVILASRFAAGLSGSAPLAIVAGMYVDFLNPPERGIATSVFSLGVFCGPVTGPVLGTMVTDRFGWRWTVWMTLFMGLGLGLLCVLSTPETAEHVLLRRRAHALRLKTADWALHARCEETPVDMRAFRERYLTKPVKMLSAEPVLAIFTVYMSLVYGILYLTLMLYPYAFGKGRGMSAVQASLPFLYLLLGIVLACIVLALYSVYYIGRRQAATKPLTPEHRLPPVILGSLFLPSGLLWFACTCDGDIAWHLQAASGVFIGFGIILVFMSSLHYLVEVYLLHANSALAINTCVRSIIAACFPVLSGHMLSALEVEWSGILLAGLCLLLAPFPVLMMCYGARVRGWSKFCRH
ncbi:Major Facilitator Superfamily transporter [Teratosphaeria destructans]|uniref:Cercosporin MFS transporter CTB4 n=1 Tax=Teratosphaeria destructans TaxID=418781 RepID=A0A9W7T0F8_9PEZI|nr:Major Facilitator Superfamily transporter [Teratosphaeria destructans]